MPHRIFITGAAGYIGGMLCDQFSKRDDVETVIGLDVAPMPDLLHGNTKIVWVAGKTTAPDWRADVAARAPDVVIHAAWVIRETYGAPDTGLNIAGADAVFDFAFATPSIKRLLHFSTVAGYGAAANNTIAHRFAEDAPLVPDDFRYAEEKRIAEVHLDEKFTASDRTTQVVVLRPAAVTGPRGRSRSSLVGLQSAINGNLKGSFSERIVGALMKFIPVTPQWCRQFVHEDDLAAVVMRLALDALPAAYNRFNVSPPGPPMTGADMAAAFDKRPFPVHPQLIRLAFFLAWHGTRGRIPTARGTWKSYSYPIVVDGSALAGVYDYVYRYGCSDAFTQDCGHYAKGAR